MRLAFSPTELRPGDNSARHKVGCGSSHAPDTQLALPDAGYTGPLLRTFRDLERYLLFAEALVLGYERTQRLQYLNALLKCMDTLSAYIGALDVDQMNRLRQLLRHERDAIAALSARLQVTLP